MRWLALILTVAAAIVVPASPAGAAIGPLPPFTSGSSFATGFPTSCYFNGYIGPMGVAFDAASFFVVDGCTGTLYKFPLTGGDASSALSVGNGLNLGLAIVGGHYYATASSSFFGGRLQSGVYEFDPSTLAVTRMVAPLSDPRGIAADPVTGDLYVATNGSGIYRIQDPAGSPLVTSFGAGTTQGFGDGIDVTPDGSTLYVVVDDGLVRRYDLATGLVDPSFQVSLASHVPDGIAVADPGTIVGGVDVSNNVFVNSNDGTIERIDVNNGNAVSVVAQGGSRGDFATVGPDRCMYVTQSSEIDALSPCFFQTPLVHPTSTSVACDPAMYPIGSQTVCTATVSDISKTDPTPPTGTVTWSSSAAGGSFTAQTCTLAVTGATGVASCSVDYSDAADTTDTITASYGTDSTHLVSSGTATATALLSVALTPSERITVGDDVSILVGILLGESESVTAKDDVSIQLGPPPDATPPVITPILTGTLGANGWYTSDVQVSWDVSDPESSISSQSGCNATTVATDTTGTVFTCTATSAGGTASQTVTVKRDAAPPSIQASQSPAPNGAGWNNSDVTVKFDCSDDTSGIASCTEPITLHEGTDQSATGTATDQAGNTASATLDHVDVDETAPSLVGNPTTAPNVNGWYSGDVTIHWTCSDSGGSGIAGSCPADDTITGEGSGLTASQNVSDVAGNVTSATSSPVNVDRTAPVTTASAPSGWSNTGVTVTLAATDNLSGVDTTYWQLDGGMTESGTTVAISDEGIHTLAYWSADEAGNVEAKHIVTVKIDKTAPTITHTQTPPPNAAGWNRSSVSVVFECADALSGIASCTPAQLLTNEGKAQAVTGKALDNAGNSASETALVSIDETPPTIAAAPDRSPNPNGWYKADVLVSFTCGDTLSGIVSCPASVTVGEGKAQSVTGTATDAADNTASTTLGGLNVDETPPVVTFTGGGSYTVDQTVTITCTATDALSGVAGSSCANVSGPAWRFGLGTTSVSATATDYAGNIGSGSTSFTVDVTCASLKTLVGRWVTDPDVAASLQDKIDAICSASTQTAKSGKLGAFDNQVDAQTGKSITADRAMLLKQFAAAL